MSLRMYSGCVGAGTGGEYRGQMSSKESMKTIQKSVTLVKAIQNRGVPVCRWLLTLTILLSLPLAVRAQQPPAAPTGAASTDATIASAYAPVKLNNRRLFDVLGDKGLSASDRADKVHRRLVNLLLRDEPVAPFTSADLHEQANQTTVLLGGEAIVTVTDGDAQDALTTRRELALQWGQKLYRAVADARATRANPVTGAGILIRDSFADLLRSILRWIPHLAGAMILTVIFWFVARVMRWIARNVVSRTHFDSNLRQLFLALAFYGTWTVGLIAILSTLGLDSGSIATTVGISGFVLGFAFKDILSHFFAGFMLLLGRQFHIGDQIVVREFEGTVERIELRALYLRTYDNRLVIIPNGDVFTSIVTSNTASAHRRREFPISIGYADDIARAMQVALDTVRGVEGVAADPAPDILVDQLAASGVSLIVRFHTNSQRADYLKVGSACMRQVKEAFDREHIALPTGVQTIFIKNVADAIKALDAPAPEQAAGEA